MMDMHVHILPGVDDGARDAQMTRRMVSRAADAGITWMIATPHVYRAEDQHRNRRGLRIARAIAHEAGIGLGLGCEFNYRALLKVPPERLDAYCLSGTRCILLEFGCDQLPPQWDTMISAMTDCGYLPIIAHPERYSYLQRDFGVAREMRDLGCELQVDAGGLMAPPLSAERRTARRLLREGMAAYVASDAHRPEDYDGYERAYRTFYGEWPQGGRLMQALRAERGRHGTQAPAR